MPANRATIRGNPGPQITRTGRTYNTETGLYTTEIEYGGSELGISGLAAKFRDSNREHRLGYENGFSTVTVYTPEQGAPVLDKYEIQWEMEQRSIWNHPVVKQAARDYDDTIEGGLDPNTFRKLAEDAVDGPLSAIATADPVSGPTFVRVVAHLRAGIDSWEQEYVTLRRTRTVPSGQAAPVTISAVSPIYTTAQLLLPGDVAFLLPDITTLVEPDPTNFRWGWRRRPSTSTIQGQANEQTSEFILAAWSLLFFEPATSNATW